MSDHQLGSLGGPREVSRHPQFEPEVKRAILASWASDACALRSRPTLQKPSELPRPIPVEEVLDALKSLDAP